MLDDAVGICRVVIACGYVNLRKGIDGLPIIIGDRYLRILLKKKHYSSSVADGLTVSHSR